jgi:hypothetical protein
MPHPFFRAQRRLVKISDESHTLRIVSLAVADARLA